MDEEAKVRGIVYVVEEAKTYGARGFRKRNYPGGRAGRHKRRLNPANRRSLQEIFPRRQRPLP